MKANIKRKHVGIFEGLKLIATSYGASEEDLRDLKSIPDMLIKIAELKSGSEIEFDEDEAVVPSEEETNGEE